MDEANESLHAPRLPYYELGIWVVAKGTGKAWGTRATPVGTQLLIYIRFRKINPISSPLPASLDLLYASICLFPFLNQS